MDAAKVDLLVDAYQTTLATARQRFGNGSETRIALAIVAENARAARQRLVTEAARGDLATTRLDKFLAEAAPADLVGKSLAASEKKLLAAAQLVMQWVINTALGVAAPPVIAGVLGVVATLTGLLHGVGQAIGLGIAAVAIGGFAVLSRYPHLIGHAVRAAGQGATGVRESLEWSADRFTSAVLTAGQLGLGAERLVDEALRPVAQQFFGNSPRPPGWEQASKARKTAQGILYVASGIVAVCGIIVILGVYDGLLEGLEGTPLDPTPTPTTSCLFGDC